MYFLAMPKGRITVVKLPFFSYIRQMNKKKIYKNAHTLKIKCIFAAREQYFFSN
jgi:hypothetical protein